MRAASRLYVLHVSLAAVGLATLGAALPIGFSNLSLSSPSSAAVAAACRHWLPALSLGGWLLLVFMILTAVCVIRGLRRMAGDLSASRRYVGSLAVAEPRIVGGVRFQLIDDALPLAFCAGFLRPRIYVSCGTIEQLNSAELHAVLAHENHHCRRRDPLRILIGRALAAALFFVPILRSSSERFAALGELAADEAAVERAGSRRALASALIKFSDTAVAPAARISPDRVDHLAGEGRATAWRLSPAAMSASLAALGTLAVTVVVLAQSASAAHMELPLLFAQSCMLAMTIGPALVAGWLGLRLHRRFAAT